MGSWGSVSAGQVVTACASRARWHVVVALLAGVALGGCQKVAGDDCDKNSDCGERLSCVDGKCTLLMAEGKPCAKDAHCKEGLTCLEERCFARRGEAAPCERTVQCEEGLICHGEQCRSTSTIERSEKERAVRSKQALRDLFSAKFGEQVGSLAEVPGAAGLQAAFAAVVAAVASERFDEVPARLAEAGVELTPLLSSVAAAQPRLTEQMKAAMAEHDASGYASLQSEQRQNGKLLKRLKGLAATTIKGMGACLLTGPAAARVSALRSSVALRDGVSKRATGPAAEGYGVELRRLTARTAKDEPDDATRALMLGLAGIKTGTP